MRTPVSRGFAEAIGADGYGENAPEAVELIKQIVAEAARECNSVSIADVQCITRLAIEREHLV